MKRVLFIIQALPLLLPAGVISFGAVGVGLLLLNEFYLLFILLLGLPLAALAMVLAYRVYMHDEGAATAPERIK